MCKEETSSNNSEKISNSTLYVRNARIVNLLSLLPALVKEPFMWHNLKDVCMELVQISKRLRDAWMFVEVFLAAASTIYTNHVGYLKNV